MWQSPRQRTDGRHHESISLTHSYASQQQATEGPSFPHQARCIAEPYPAAVHDPEDHIRLAGQNMPQATLSVLSMELPYQRSRPVHYYCRCNRTALLCAIGREKGGSGRCHVPRCQTTFMRSTRAWAKSGPLSRKKDDMHEKGATMMGHTRFQLTYASSYASTSSS